MLGGRPCALLSPPLQDTPMHAPPSLPPGCFKPPPGPTLTCGASLHISSTPSALHRSSSSDRMTQLPVGGHVCEGVPTETGQSKVKQRKQLLLCCCAAAAVCGFWSDMSQTVCLIEV